MADERRDWQWRHIHLSADPIAPITDVIVVEQIGRTVLIIAADQSVTIKMLGIGTVCPKAATDGEAQQND